MKTWKLLLALAVLLSFVLLYKYIVFGILLIVGVLVFRLAKRIYKGKPE